MKKYHSQITLAMLGLLLILFFYGNVLFQPNHFLFSDQGDGLKNYYTFYYHSVNDTSAISFNGLNYPYGEHLFYTDSHPLFTVLFQSIRPFLSSDNFPIIGALNLLLILSIWLNFFIVFRLLKAFSINAWIAIFFALVIVGLQPQLFRLTGHLSLSYSIAFPLTWLILVCSYKNETNHRLLVLLFINNLGWFFIHAYLGMILVSFQLVFYVGVLIKNKIQRRNVMPYLRFLTAALFPVLIFWLIAYFTDTHLNRTTNPSGFFLYNAEPDDFFVPHHPPFRPLLDKIPGLDINLQWEAWNYLGLMFSLALFIQLIRFLTSFFGERFQKKSMVSALPPVLVISLLSSLVLVAFAMGLPFKWYPPLLDAVPYIKEFRATGRFGWPFFYVGSVTAVYGIYSYVTLLKLKGKTVLSNLILVITIGVSAIEGLFYHADISKKIAQSPNLFNPTLLDSDMQDLIKNTKPGDYQALLPLPYYHMGSESFSRPIDPEIFTLSITLSAHTGLPIIGNNLTRTSITESKNLVQLMSPAYYPKKIESDFNSNQPILVIAQSAKLTSYEAKVLEKANLYKSYSKFSVYTLSPKHLFASDYNSEINAFKTIQNELIKKGQFLMSDTSEFIYFDDFESQLSNVAFFSSGAYKGLKTGKNTFAHFPAGTFKKDKTYSLSMWMYNDYPDALNLWFRLILAEYDTENNRWHETTVFPQESEVIFGDWSLVEMEFSIMDSKNEVFIISKGKPNQKSPLHADNLLIRDQRNEVYKVLREGKNPILFKNNHYIQP